MLAYWFLSEKYIMNNILTLFACALTGLAATTVAVADDEFYGIIESYPDSKLGIWIVGKRSVEVTEDTELEEENGPLEIGACAEVKVEAGTADEIESESADKCK